jgi:hypothetical protein
MSTGVLVVLAGVAWFFALRAGRYIAMTIAAFVIGVMLTAGGGPLAGTALTLIDGSRNVVATVGDAISAHR